MVQAQLSADADPGDKVEILGDPVAVASFVSQLNMSVAEQELVLDNSERLRLGRILVMGSIEFNEDGRWKLSFRVSRAQFAAEPLVPGSEQRATMGSQRA